MTDSKSHFRFKDLQRFKLKEWKKILHVSGKQKRAGVTIVILDKTDFKSKTLIRDKEEHYKKINGLIHKEDTKDTIIINKCAPNIITPKNIKQTLTELKGKIKSNTIIVGDFHTPHSIMDRTSGQKINKETVDLDNTIHQIDLTDISRTFYTKSAEYTFLSSTDRTFSRIGHMLVHKTSLNKH